MILIYEDSGKMQAGREFSRADSSLQVESASGKRSKIKLQQVMLELAQEAIPDLHDAALRQQADAVDLNLAWEFAPEAEFSARDLALDYFGNQASAAEQMAMLLALVGAPHYFRRAGKNRFKKAAADVLQQALAAIEKKKRLAEQISVWAQRLQAGDCPEEIAARLYQILFKPDKNSAEYKAVAEAVQASQKSVLELFQAAGQIAADAAGAYAFHWQRFLFSHFPKGTGFVDLPLPAFDADELPLAEGVAAFSIDDSSTTEIDDALSVQHLDRALVTVGIHIAAPALALQPGQAWYEVASQRLSTVYMPGQKITMLPDELVQQFTLGAGQARPALSLYLQIDKDSLEILDAQTKVERIPVAANLHLEALEPLCQPEALLAAAQGGPAQAPLQTALQEALGESALAALPDLAHKLGFLFRLAQHWKAGREAVRGKPENFSRPDFGFKLWRDGQVVKGDVTGLESVRIEPRRRGEPLDLIVAECAIAANSTWGQWLGGLGLPMIYRSQAALAPGVKVRMGVKPQRHAGMGVPAYAWSTSPLRRFVDLLNQGQLLAAVQHGAVAGLHAPYKPKDAQLFAVISSFDAAYSAYNAYQGQMERFWTLRYINENGVQELDGVVFKDEGWFRADHLPISLQVLGAQDLPRGSRIRVRLGEVDLLNLHINGTLLAELAPGLDALDTDDGEDDAESDADALDLALPEMAPAEGDASTEAMGAAPDAPTA